MKRTVSGFRTMSEVMIMNSARFNVRRKPGLARTIPQPLKLTNWLPMAGPLQFPYPKNLQQLVTNIGRTMNLRNTTRVGSERTATLTCP